MKSRSLLLTLTVGLLSCLQLGGSCASTGGSGGDYSTQGSSGNSSGGSLSSSGNDYREYDRPNRIPRWSDVVREGTGKLRWTADTDGDIYVYDGQESFIPYTGPIRRGQEILVEPADDHIYVNGKLVYKENLRKDAQYTVYFARTRPDTGRTPVVDQDKADPLPRGAVSLDHGTGALRIQSAPRPGVVYVYDEVDRKIIYKSPACKRGDDFRLVRSDGTITLNGRRIKSMTFPRGHALALYYGAN